MIAGAWGFSTTRHTATKRAIDRLAHRVYAAGAAYLRQAPLRTICFLLEARPDGLVLNLGAALVGGTLSAVKGVTQGLGREAWRFSTMSHEVRKVDRRASKGDYGGAMELIDDLAAQGSAGAPTAAAARRRVLLAMARGVETGNRGAQPTSVGEQERRTEERAGLYRGLLQDLSSSNASQPQNGRLQRYNARTLALIKRKLTGISGSRGQIRKAVKAGHPWEVEAAYDLLEATTQELDPNYAIATDATASARRRSDLQRATFEQAERAAFDAFTMARHPERFAGPDQAAEDVRERAATQLAMAQQIVEGVERELGPVDGKNAALARLAKYHLGMAERQFNAGMLTLGRQRLTDTIGSGLSNLSWILWTWLRHGALLMPQGEHVNRKMQEVAANRAIQNRQEQNRAAAGAMGAGN
ncbi:MAG: hypothetical protein IPL40_11690 [Proteobacteria bacterium]|nr:hypothetical protein [Pseudomonadota bacterium]